MKQNLETSTILGRLIIVVVLGLSIWLLVLIAGANREIQIASLTAIGSVTGLILTQRNLKKREIEARFFVHKSEVYREVYDLTWDLLAANITKKKPISHNQLMKRVLEIKKGIMIWGSANTFRAWMRVSNFDADPSDETDNTKLFLVWGNLFKEMRHDLGHDDSTLNDADFIKYILDQKGQDEFDAGLDADD